MSATLDLIRGVDALQLGRAPREWTKRTRAIRNTPPARLSIGGQPTARPVGTEPRERRASEQIRIEDPHTRSAPVSAPDRGPRKRETDRRKTRDGAVALAVASAVSSACAAIALLSRFRVRRYTTSKTRRLSDASNGRAGRAPSVARGPVCVLRVAAPAERTRGGRAYSGRRSLAEGFN